MSGQTAGDRLIGYSVNRGGSEGNSRLFAYAVNRGGSESVGLECRSLRC